jgi:hypothetical protein
MQRKADRGAIERVPPSEYESEDEELPPRMMRGLVKQSLYVNQREDKEFSNKDR